MIASVGLNVFLVSFSVARIEYAVKSNFREESVIEMPSVMGRQVQELQVAAGHIIKQQESMSVLSSLFPFHTVQDPLPCLTENEAGPSTSMI